VGTARQPSAYVKAVSCTRCASREDTVLHLVELRSSRPEGQLHRGCTCACDLPRLVTAVPILQRTDLLCPRYLAHGALPNKVGKYMHVERCGRPQRHCWRTEPEAFSV